ncbi:PAS domain-containing protein [Phaeovibrio sulfidiphilus]|uniref:PAS domain-containing protein n=1 Tax=Phaeovibrio sulfidiphilus TaxID=1220600 RepID=A0A8J7CDG0_9PROT|nr:PAS domain-containing protein [Phaeovibrio sulfidiphilus]MBE1236994.1 PAS domain-containing protein [Phaeovibrio sulfidiphilus]
MTENSNSPVLRTPDLKRLYEKWRELCHSGAIPMAVDVDPADLRPWLKNLAVIKVTPDGQYVYGYYSAGYAEIFDGDKVGKSIDSLPAAQRNILLQEYETVRQEQTPVSRTYTALFDGEEQTWERLVLPFLSHGGEVEKLLVAAYRVS